MTEIKNGNQGALITCMADGRFNVSIVVNCRISFDHPDAVVVAAKRFNSEAAATRWASKQMEG